MDQSHADIFESFEQTMVQIRRLIDEFDSENESVNAEIENSGDFAYNMLRSIETVREYVENDELTGEELEKTMENLSIVAEEQQDALSAGRQVLASFDGLKSALSHFNDLQESVDSQIMIRG